MLKFDYNRIIVFFPKTKSGYGHAWYCFSYVQLFVTLWTMGFSKQEYWRGFPFPPSGDLSRD